MYITILWNYYHDNYNQTSLYIYRDIDIWNDHFLYSPIFLKKKGKKKKRKDNLKVKKGVTANAAKCLFGSLDPILVHVLSDVLTHV